MMTNAGAFIIMFFEILAIISIPVVGLFAAVMGVKSIIETQVDKTLKDVEDALDDE